MSFQWMQMRITEEKERRAREEAILERLPRAVEELQLALRACMEAYTAAFGEASARLAREGLRLIVTAGDRSVEVAVLPQLPGIEIQRDETIQRVQVGILPGDRLYYLDLAADQYLTMEELTRRILDRVLFPKLKE